MLVDVKQREETDGDLVAQVSKDKTAQ